jgi:RimJ/RimL family protein N-acetyltransferase
MNGCVVEERDVERQQITVRSPTKPEDSVTLYLQPLSIDDLEDFYTLHSDARVWEHLPSGRHTDIEKTKKWLETCIDDWKTSGLGYWSVKSSDGQFAGVGGARLMSKDESKVWNLYYRVSYAWWGCGIAAKLASKAMEAAHIVQPDIPIVAFLLEHNAASRHIAEKALKMQLRWRGPDAGNEDPAAIRLVYSDRPMKEAALQVVTT